MVEIDLIGTSAKVKNGGNQARFSTVSVGECGVSIIIAPDGRTCHNLFAPAHGNVITLEVLGIEVVGTDSDGTAGGVERDGADPVGGQVRSTAVSAQVDIIGSGRRHGGDRQGGGEASDVTDDSAFVFGVKAGEAVFHIIAGHKVVGRGPGHHALAVDARPIGAEAALKGGGGSLHSVPAGRSAATHLTDIEVVGGATVETGNIGIQGCRGLALTLGIGVEVRIGAVFHLIAVASAGDSPFHMDGVPGGSSGGDTSRLHTSRLGEGVDGSLFGIIGGGEGARAAGGGTGQGAPVGGSALAGGAEDVGAGLQAGEDADGAAKGHRTVAELDVTVRVELQLEAVAAVSVGGDFAPFHSEHLSAALVVDGVGRRAVTGGVVQRCELRAGDARKLGTTVIVDTQGAAGCNLVFTKIHRKRHRNVHVTGGLVSRRPDGITSRANNRAVGSGGGRAIILANLRVLSLCDPGHH